MICLTDGDPLAYIAAWGNSEEEAKVKIDDLVQEIPESVFADDHRIAIKGSGNFRDSLTGDYKAHRKVEPEYASLIRTLREYLISDHGAIPADGQEADDLLAQWATECNQNDEEWVIASIDKDLLTIPGVHYNIRKGTIDHIDEDTADYLLNMQLLTGDRADNIQGLKGIGPKKAENILAGTAFGKRRQAVIGAYREHYGQEWETELQLTGDLIFIRGVKDERFKI
jgi:DNA polymerase-1